MRLALDKHAGRGRPPARPAACLLSASARQGQRDPPGETQRGKDLERQGAV